MSFVRAASLRRAAVGAVGIARAVTGRGLAPAATARRRLSICTDCPRRVGVICRDCGCIVRAKVKLADERCPRRNW